jgi:hypothetical protein
MRDEKRASPRTLKLVALILKKLIGNLDWPQDPNGCVVMLSSGEMPRPVDRVNGMVREIHALIDSAQSRTEMVNCILAYPVADEMQRFWEVVNGLARNLGIPHIQSVLSQAGMPPGIPTKEGETLLLAAERILDGQVVLTKPQQIVWSLVTTAYPPHTSASSSGLKDAARWLAWYWDKAVLERADLTCKKKRWKPAMADIGAGWDSRALEVWLLSWLELPLVMQMNVVSTGKARLHRLGKWFEENT